MKIDYDVGDVVVCVNSFNAPMLSMGGIYRVSRFLRLAYPGRTSLGNIDDLGVFINGVNASAQTGAFDVRRFRKLPKADEQFTEQMRRCKPAKRKVDA